MRDAELKALTGLCAKCGTCRTVCTLYPERKAEIAVARGKIALIDAAMSGGDDDAEGVQEALTDCLLCGRCERACPNRGNADRSPAARPRSGDSPPSHR